MLSNWRELYRNKTVRTLLFNVAIIGIALCARTITPAVTSVPDKSYIEKPKPSPSDNPPHQYPIPFWPFVGMTGPTPIPVPDVADDQGSNYSESVSVRLRMRPRPSEDYGASPNDDLNKNLVSTGATPISKSDLEENFGSGLSDGVDARLRRKSWLDSAQGVLGKLAPASDDANVLADSLAGIVVAPAKPSDDYGTSFSDTFAGQTRQRALPSEDANSFSESFQGRLAYRGPSLSEDYGSSPADSLLGRTPVRASISDNFGSSLADEVESDQGPVLKSRAQISDDYGSSPADSLAARVADRVQIGDDVGQSYDDIVDKSLVDTGGGTTPINVTDIEDAYLSSAADALSAITVDRAAFSDDIGQSLSDSEAARLNQRSLPSDQVSQSDDLSSIQRSRADISDSQSASDDLSARRTSLAQLSESQSPSDDLTAQLRRSAQLSESQSPSDDLSGILKSLAVLSESQSPTDDLSTRYKTLAQPTESQSPSDDLSARFVEKAQPSEQVDITDDVQSRTDQQKTAQCQDDADTTVDSLSALFRNRAGPSDSLSQTDDLSARLRQLGSLSDTVSQSDDLSALNKRRATFTDDANSASDSLSGLTKQRAQISDDHGQNPSDSLASLQKSRAAISDDLGSSITDQVDKNLTSGSVTPINKTLDEDYGASLSDEAAGRLRRKSWIDQVTHELKTPGNWKTGTPSDNYGSELSDALSSRLNRRSSGASEALDITEATLSLTGEYNTELDDDIGSSLSDSMSARLVYKAQLSDQPTQTDSMSGYTYGPAIISDSYWGEPLDTDLWAYWTFDETSGTRFDSVDSHHLTPTGCSFSTGKINNCVTFGSVTDVLQLGDPGPFEDNFTIGFWIKAGGSATGYCLDINSDCAVYVDRNSSGNIWFSAYTSSLGVMTTNTWSPDTWHLVVVYYNGTGLYLEVDNVLQDSDLGTSGNSSPSSYDLYIGYPASSNYAYLDEYGIWSRALTQSERAWLYNSGVGRTRDSSWAIYAADSMSALLRHRAIITDEISQSESAIVQAPASTTATPIFASPSEDMGSAISDQVSAVFSTAYFPSENLGADYSDSLSGSVYAPASPIPNDNYGVSILDSMSARLTRLGFPSEDSWISDNVSGSLTFRASPSDNIGQEMSDTMGTESIWKRMRFKWKVPR